MEANGTVIGGQATTEEMCNSNLAYYPAIDFNTCRSVLVMTDLLTELGMENLDGRYTQICSLKYFPFMPSTVQYGDKKQTF